MGLRKLSNFVIFLNFNVCLLSLRVLTIAQVQLHPVETSLLITTFSFVRTLVSFACLRITLNY